MSHNHYVVVKSGSNGHFDLCRINIFVVNENNSSSTVSDFYFPVVETVTSVQENSPAGTFVFRPPYVASGKERVSFWTESETFTVNPETGDISTRAGLDFESAADHHLQVFAKTTEEVQVEVQLEVYMRSRRQRRSRRRGSSNQYAVELDVYAYVGATSRRRRRRRRRRRSR